MKVGELRKQGFKAIAGDTLTNGLSDSIKLSIGGAAAVNSGHHDDLEVVDLLWRTEHFDGFIGIVDCEANCWRPYIAKSACADNKVKFVDNETANATVKAHIESMRPVFTQAMADDGEFPPVGIELIIVNKTECQRIDEFIGEPILIINACEYKNKYVITWFHPTHGLCCGNYNNKTFNVFDARTKKEKAVNIANKEFFVDKPTLEAIYDLWSYKIEQ